MKLFRILALTASLALVACAQTPVQPEPAAIPAKPLPKVVVQTPAGSGATRRAAAQCRADRESAARLFEPFYSTEELGRGRGLGLSTVYGAIRQCGGYVFVDSSIENGTVFDLYLPAAAGEPAATAVVPTVAAPAASAGATILLVEDEDLIRSLAEQILVERGYRIFAASNASEAIDLATRVNTTIDLLLTDIVMPGASGSDLAQRLLRSFPEMRVLFMSGYSDSLIFRFGVLQERSAFLQKPFSADVLERKVRDLLAT